MATTWTSTSTTWPRCSTSSTFATRSWSAGRASVKLVKHAVLEEYAGAPHGLTATHKDQLNRDLLVFIRS
jgi:hypothetical protein